MTPQQIEDMARRKYNSVGSGFFAEAEIWDLIYQAECEIASETRLLEHTVGLGTTGNIGFSLLESIQEITKVIYDGTILERIDMRQAERLGFDPASVEEVVGTPRYYLEKVSGLGEQILVLFPEPPTSIIVSIYGNRVPARIEDADQTLEVPSMWHSCIVDYVVAEMAAKDKQWDTANFYFSKWYDKHLPKIIKWDRRRKTGDRFNVVKDEATYNRVTLVEE